MQALIIVDVVNNNAVLTIIIIFYTSIFPLSLLAPSVSKVRSHHPRVRKYLLDLSLVH